MRTIPLETGPMHFIGIGGIGMSGIAEVLHNLGYKVQGSDLSDNANCQRLRDLGIPVATGHAAENVGDAAVVVYSSAVTPENPEMVEARKRRLPVVRRADMLAELMRLKWSIAIAGTHGKTTTTSLVATMLDKAGLDPTIINGGIINALGTNARLGKGDWLVAEADESDGTFLRLPATIGVVTNIDPEHLDHYGTFDKIREAFHDFVAGLPFYGFGVLCLDHPEVQALVSKVTDRRIITYGTTPQADIRAMGIRPDKNGITYDVQVSDRVGKGGARTLANVRLNLFGQHNVLNALATITVGIELGIPDAVILDSLAHFEGVKRRFTKTGEVGGITIIDDYAHHPVEIMAVLKAAREAAGDARVIAVMQPHRYTRLSSLFDPFCSCFHDADIVRIADVYAAGESPLPGMDKNALVEGVRAHGHRDVAALESPDALAEEIHRIAKPGDFVICLGAGSISQWAYALPKQLESLEAVP
ncbi:MAG TPA: UDP-N-acetylmuramate--L-alanine ligase [Rhodospirillaceae bacterium]|nr:MAG: UDP-N-acetylmuramate--L-alanine ligase [Alphaproteobacteria bacterium GWF2_58_20]HAU30003.1 UDP-N-acetylmuramate--L-alanine ligase [Rhodospirillaceae bacterium]